MDQECQKVADQQTFSEGDPRHLVLAQTKALSDPLDIRLMPQQDRAGLLRLLWLLGFLAHRSILPPTSLRCPAHLFLQGGHPELAQQEGGRGPGTTMAEDAALGREG